MNSKCPNIHDKDYQRMSFVLGGQAAQEAWLLNDGQPLWLTSKGDNNDAFNGLRTTLSFSDSIRSAYRLLSHGAINNNGDIVNQEVYDKTINSYTALRNNQGSRLVTAVMDNKACARGLAAVVDMVERSTPGLRIHRESSQTMMEKGYSRSLSGFVDSEGYHVNMDAVGVRTPMHELSHVLMPIIRATSPDVYEKIQDALDDYLSRGNIMAQMRLKYPRRSEAEIRDEVIAQIAGAATEKAVERFLAGRDIPFNRAMISEDYRIIQPLHKRIWSFITDIIQKIFGVTIDGHDYMTTFFDKIAYHVLSGGVLPGFNENTMTYLNEALETYSNNSKKPSVMFYGDDHLDDEMEQDRMNEGYEPIRSISDIAPFLMNNDDAAGSRERSSSMMENRTLFANTLFSRLSASKTSNVYRLEWMGRVFEFEKNLSPEAIKKRIIDEILPFHKKRVDAFPATVRETVLATQAGEETMMEAIERKFKDERDRLTVNKFEIKKMMGLIGAEDNIVDILTLSELMQSTKYSKLSALIDASFIGNNPTVIIHKSENNEYDISISDISTGDLSFDGVYTGKNRKLGARLTTDIRNPERHNALTNSRMDVQLAMLATTIASMRGMAYKNGIKLRIRRAGVYGIAGGGKARLRAKTIIDFNDTFRQVRGVLQNPIITKMITNPSLLETINNDQAWETDDMHVSHLFEMDSFYANDINKFNITDSMISRMTDSDISHDERIDLIRRRMRFLEAEFDEAVVENSEYQMLSRSVMEMRRGLHISEMNFDDLTSWTMKAINPHNISNSLLQYAFIEMETAHQMVMRRTLTFEDGFNKLIKDVKKARGLSTTSAEQVFARMFPEIEVTIDKDYKKTNEHDDFVKGQKVKVKLFNTIFNHNYHDQALINRMLAERTITEEELALGDFILKTVRDLYVMSIYEKGKRRTSKFTMDQAIENFESIYQPDTIPVMPATQVQLLKGAHLKEWMNNFTTMLSKGDIVYADMNSKNFSEVSGLLDRQIGLDEQLRSMGIRAAGFDQNGQQQYKAFDIEALYLQTNNLEYMIKFFNMEQHRKVIFNEHVVPLYKELHAISTYVKNATGNEQRNAMTYWDEYYDYIVNRKYVDDNAQDSLTKRVAPIVRGAIALNSFVNIGFRPVIWLKSAYYNEQNQLLASIANVAANMGHVENRVDLPSPNEMRKAHEIVLTNLKKCWRMAEVFQLINAQERDVLDNLERNITDKHLIKKQIAHLGNHYSDAAARTVTMVAFMLHDGSWDAHSYNEETEEISYDPKKDKRLFNDDGVYKPGHNEIHKAIIEAQRRQGLLVDDKQIIGYDFEEINNRMKWYVDKYIIGSMDSHHRTMMGNQFLGAAFGQFRTFSWDKLWNFGIGQTVSNYGGRFKAIQDADGNWLTVREQILIEGHLRTLYEVGKAIIEAKGMSADTWNKMPPMRRRNLVDLAGRGVMLALFLSIMAMFRDDDDDKKKREKFVAELMKRNPDLTRDEALSAWRKHSGHMSDADLKKLHFLWSDIFIWDTVSSMYDNPIPLFRSLGDIYDLAIGKDFLKRVVRFVGPANDTFWMYGLFSKHDDPFNGDLSRREREELRLEKKRQEEYERARREAEEKINYDEYVNLF